MTLPALTALHVSHRFPGAAGLAIENMSLQVAPGEMVCLLGPSGCGKSTLLSILGGLTRPTEGEVRINGTVLDGPRPSDIAFVFQESVLFPWNSVLTDLEIALEFRGVPKRERRDRAMAALQTVGMAEFAQHRR